MKIIALLSFTAKWRGLENTALSKISHRKGKIPLSFFCGKKKKKDQPENGIVTARDWNGGREWGKWRRPVDPINA